MTVVVDATIALKWFVDETGRERALRVLGAPERHAPYLIVAEAGECRLAKGGPGRNHRSAGALHVRVAEALFRRSASERALSISNAGETFVTKSRHIDILSYEAGKVVGSFVVTVASEGRSEEAIEVQRRLRGIDAFRVQCAGAATVGRARGSIHGR